MTTYRTDVRFLEDASPALIDRGAQEYARLHRLMESTDESFLKAARIDWRSEARDLYVGRLKETKELADTLSAAFRSVGTALAAYADAVTTAKSHYRSGVSSEGELARVISREATAITPTARAATPMRQWEDLRGTTGVLDFLAEVTVDVDAIREDADRLHGQAAGHYDDARRAESEARHTCVAAIRAAHRTIPEYQGPAGDPAALLRGLGPLQREVREAGSGALLQLPGTGVKTDEISTVGGNVVVTEALSRISTRVAGLPEAPGHYLPFWSNSDEGRREYIAAHRELIRAAAHDSGLPPEMVAGIAWKEVEGDPTWQDDIAQTTRNAFSGGQAADLTSMGPMAIQVRRAAEVLGYDPHHLTDTQRDVVVDAVRDPAKNIFIASEYLAQLKAESGFADVPPEQMTRAQMQELAARYNGGPYYKDPNAERYGRQFDDHVDQAKEALG